MNTSISSVFGNSFETSKVHKLVYESLDYRSLRQSLISSNIANVDTPFYRPRDISFEDLLSKKQDIVLNGDSSKVLMMAKAYRGHLDGHLDDDNKADLFFRDGHLARNDGNSVDLDVETSEMGKNSLVYQALSAALKKHKGIFTYALESGRNL